MSRILPTLGTARSDAVRITESAHAVDGVLSLAEVREWFAERRRIDVARVTRIGLDDLVGWHTEPDTGNLVHDSGRFFRVEGLSTEVPGAAVPAWSQPIITQSEIGLLGILAKEFDGVLHFLMQAKNEPGNVNGVELSPTVQATRSNYTRVHRGNAVPYVDYFIEPGRRRIIADVLQSEQGAWFYRKRNRNITVEVTEDVPDREGFAWLTLGQIHRLLAEEAVINMDARTVLSCLPFAGAGLSASFPGGDGEFRRSVLRSLSEDSGGRHRYGDILHWITGTRARHEVRARTVPLAGVAHWRRTPEAVVHESGLFFRVMAISVETGHREVRGWTQPMVEPIGIGVNAFLVKRIDGVLHALVHARVQPGFLDVIELAPTVQCTPGNYTWLPPEARPRFLDEVLGARPDQVRFESVLSEEGGRFFEGRNRYLVIEADDGYEPEPAGDFRWLTLHQLASLLQHSHYLNVEARSLVACLHSLAGAAALPD